MLNLTERDEGKKVVDQTGERIGIITEIESGKAYVDPEPVVPQPIKRKLDWEGAETAQQELKNSMVHSITDSKVRIRR
jgi:hypothetical protein